jgi:hypothetical protein
VYNVVQPHRLWHIDGHHALDRWGLVTHGAIDGASRVVLYLHCADNNLPSTPLEQFVKACDMYQIPSCVRMDKGGENVKIADFMIHHRGFQPGRMPPFIAGKSKHNTRIERLWVDVYRVVIDYYYRLFYHMEHEGVLDITNDIDKWV